MAELAAPEEVKSVSSERTFARDLVDADEVASAVRYIASLTARRLRAKGLRGRTVTLKCTFRYGETRTARTTLPRRTDDEQALAGAGLDLLGRVWSEGTPVRLLGIGVSNWDDASVQLGLFDDPTTRARNGHGGASARRPTRCAGDSAHRRPCTAAS